MAYLIMQHEMLVFDTVILFYQNIKKKIFNSIYYLTKENASVHFSLIEAGSERRLSLQLVKFEQNKNKIE